MKVFRVKFVNAASPSLNQMEDGIYVTVRLARTVVVIQAGAEPVSGSAPVQLIARRPTLQTDS